MRYFRIADDAAYESARVWLDSQFSHAPPRTCVAPAGAAPRDNSGSILLAVRDVFIGFDAVKQVLPQLLESGAVSEISEATYRAAFPPYSFKRP